MEIFYTKPDAIQGNQVRLGPEETRHITRVLRHDIGDHILVVDGEGNEYRCAITKIGPNELLGEIVSQTRRARETVTEVTLAVGALKGQKLDEVVEMATELGVAQIVPVLTSRVVAKVMPAKLQRLRAIAVSALKSSTRTVLPKVKPAQEFDQFLRESTYYDLKLIAYEGEKKQGLCDAIVGGHDRNSGSRVGGHDPEFVERIRVMSPGSCPRNSGSCPPNTWCAGRCS